MKWGRSVAARAGARAGIRVATVVLLVLAVVVVPAPSSVRRSESRSATTASETQLAQEDPAPAAESATLVAEPEVVEELAQLPDAAPVLPSPPPTGPLEVMLIGDSMAYTAAEGLAPHAGGWNFTVVNEGIMGCGVVRGGPFRHFGAQRDPEPRCEAWPEVWQAALDRNHPDLVAIVVGRWELMDRMHDGRWTNLFDPAFAAYLDTEIDQAVALASSAGSRVVVFSTPYFRRGLTASGGLFPEDDPARVDVINGILRGVAERRGVPVVDVGGWLSPEGRYTPEVGGVKVRSDGVHLTRQTGSLLAPWLFPQLQAVASTG